MTEQLFERPVPGPARAGLFIYALDSERLAQFYCRIAGMIRLHEGDELIVLQSVDFQLLLHSIPAEIAASIEIAAPPERRSNTALKFFFTVPTLNYARSQAREFGRAPVLPFAGQRRKAAHRGIRVGIHYQRSATP